MTYSKTRRRCGCGRRSINGSADVCCSCKQERGDYYSPISKLCVSCGRRARKGNDVCSHCRPKNGTAPCAICEAPSRGDTCKKCDGILKRDSRRTRVAARLRAQGMTLAEIGKTMGGISRQRVEQLLHRPENRARSAVSKAVGSGVLVKPSACERCAILEPDLEAHHADYSKPLSIQWLCVPCHNVIHPHPGGGRALPTRTLDDEPARQPAEATA